MAVLLIATLDTKGAEADFVRRRLAAAGLAVEVADAGTGGPPAFEPDVPVGRLLAEAGASADVLRAAGDRGRAVAAAADAAAELAARRHRDGALDGVFGLGGSAGTAIASAAMRAVPVGVPKVLVSTVASGQVGPYVGTRDVTLVHAVVDLAGLNRISRRVLANAADAMIGMVRGAAADAAGPPPADRPVVAATMFGVTTPCVEAAKRVVEQAGYEVVVFHATGAGGRAMEGLVGDGLVAGVLDLTTTELADQLAGGVMAAGPDRLTAAGLAGVPQVISVGALDMVNFGPPDTLPERYRGRRFYRHNPHVTLMRTTPEENDALGKELAEKASAARGPTRVLLPLRGVSAIDADGRPFWWPEADAALFASIRQWAHPPELVDEADEHINDPAFADRAARALLALMAAR